MCRDVKTWRWNTPLFPFINHCLSKHICPNRLSQNSYKRYDSVMSKYSVSSNQLLLAFSIHAICTYPGVPSTCPNNQTLISNWKRMAVHLTTRPALGWKSCHLVFVHFWFFSCYMQETKLRPYLIFHFCTWRRHDLVHLFCNSKSSMHREVTRLLKFKKIICTIFG